jgi:F-type H+-transporting ATPase subunit delta
MVLCRQLHDFQRLFSDQKDLAEALTSPFLPTAKKVEIAQEVLPKMSLKKKAERFLLILVENNRLSLLPAILDQLPLSWNEFKGIVTFEVSSVVPLNDVQKKRLADKLSRIEKKPVFLTHKIDPHLIGGISVKKGNVVYDISIQGDLERLKQKMTEG